MLLNIARVEPQVGWLCSKGSGKREAKLTDLLMGCFRDCGFFQSGCRAYSQDTFDHDKRQKSAISERHLHWIFLRFFHWICFPLCSLVRKSPQNVEKIARFPDRRKKRRILSHLWLSWFFGPDTGVSHAGEGNFRRLPAFNFDGSLTSCSPHSRG